MCVDLKNAIDEAKQKKKQASQVQQEQQTQKSTANPDAAKIKRELNSQLKQINNLYEGVIQYVSGALQNSNPIEVKENLQLYQVTIKNLSKSLQDLIIKISDPEYEQFTEKYFGELMEKQNFVNDYLEAYDQFALNVTSNGLKRLKQSLDKYLQQLEKMNVIRKSFENLAGSYQRKSTNEDVKKSFDNFNSSGFQQQKQSFEKQENGSFNQFNSFQPAKIKTSDFEKPFEFQQADSNQQQQQQQAAAEAFGGFASQIVDKPPSMGNSSIQFQFFQEGSEQNSHTEEKIEKKNQNVRDIEEIKEEETLVQQSMGFKKGNKREESALDQFGKNQEQKNSPKHSTNFDDFGSNNWGEKGIKKSSNFEEFGNFDKQSPQKPTQNFFEKQNEKNSRYATNNDENFENFNEQPPKSKKKKKKSPIKDQDQENAFPTNENADYENPFKKQKKKSNFNKNDSNDFENSFSRKQEQKAFDYYEESQFPKPSPQKKNQKSEDLENKSNNPFEAFSKKQDQFGFSDLNKDKPKNLVQKQPEWSGFTPKEESSYNSTSPKQQRRYNESEITEDFEERFSNASVSTISMMDIPMKNVLLNLKQKNYGKTIEYDGKSFADLLTKNPRDKNNRRFKLACLKDKSVLYEAGGLQIGISTQNFYDYMTSKNFSLMIIYFGNLGKSSAKMLYNFDALYSGDYTFSLWANPETLEQPLRPNTQLKQELIINYNTLPFTQINCNISYNDSQQKSHQLVVPLPALIPKFMVFKDIDKETFKYKWKLKRNDIVTSQFFKPNSHILRSSNALLRYVPKLLELTDYQQFLTQRKDAKHLQSYKLGGTFELNQPDIQFMIKISLKPNAVAFVQATGFQSQQLIVENIVQTFVFLLAAPGNDNQPIIIQPTQQTQENLQENVENEEVQEFKFDFQ